MTHGWAEQLADRLTPSRRGEPLARVHGARADARIRAPLARRLAPHLQVHAFTQRSFGPAAA